jgi:hypothetical protein
MLLLTVIFVSKSTGPWVVVGGGGGGGGFELPVGLG